MSNNLKNNEENNYYSGGLAELIPSPTPLTYSFLKEWFTGAMSIGKAMKLLNMPYSQNNLPIVELIGDELFVNLLSEEKTLYAKTIFSYTKQKDTHHIPTLSISFLKLFNPLCLFNTLKILILQSQWIANPQSSIALAKKLVDDIPTSSEEKEIEKLTKFLGFRVWPNVIAVGLLSEFYNQLALKKAKEKVSELNNYISGTIAKEDWFFRSIADQLEVKKGTLSFSEYIKKYGLRADKDYELTSPRWHEIPEIIKSRIKNSTERRMEEKEIEIVEKLRKLGDTSIALQLLRSEAKKKALISIDKLRELLLQQTQNISHIELLTKEDLKKGTMNHNNNPEKTNAKTIPSTKTLHSTQGKGISVSQGIAKGYVKNILNNDIEIAKGTIGIFPNASPEFAIQYPKCTGMIFLKGGQTSHGAIVAREFNIPAIIDNKIDGIQNGLQIELNGTTGTWQIL